MKICIDSQIIIWGIKNQATKGQESMIPKAEYFFRWADNNGHDIIIPTVVEAEILAAEPELIRSGYYDILHKNFMVVNFDTRAAAKYAEILNGRFEKVKELAKAEKIDRQKMKVDHLIIACALANGANCIYSYDNGIHKFADGFIDVRHLPEPPAKTIDLFSSIIKEEDLPF